MARNKSKFKYEVTDLIQLIEERPCLWDKSVDEYNNKLPKVIAWREICSTLDHKYEFMSEKEKEFLHEAVIEKWRNLRDAFVRSLKKKSGKPCTRKYLYHDNLQFLLKVKDFKDETDSNIVYEYYDVKHEQEETDNPLDTEHLSLDTEHLSQTPMKISGPSTPNTSDNEELGTSSISAFCTNYPRKMKRKMTSQNEINCALLQALQGTCQSNQSLRQFDEDEAFFASIIPTVRTFTSDEKLEFRMDILGLIKKIKDKR